MDEELLTTTLPKKQNGATKSIMRPSRKTAEEKSRAKILEASQNNGNCSYKLFNESFLVCHILNHFLFQNQIIKSKGYTKPWQAFRKFFCLSHIKYDTI